MLVLCVCFNYFDYFNYCVKINLLVKKPEKPQGNLVAVTYFGVVSYIIGVVCHAYFVFACGIANSEFLISVNYKIAVFATLIYFVVFPHRVYEKCFHFILLFYSDRIYGI